MSKEDNLPTDLLSSGLKKIIEETLEKYGVLKRANDYLVETVNLATVRAQPLEFPSLANALSVTIFRNTGTFNLYLQEPRDNKKIIIDALTYPQTLLIDFFDIDKVFISNSAQSGLSATIIKFFKA